MVQFNFDANQYEPTVGGSGQVYPTGTYVVLIRNTELRDTRDKTGKMLVITFRIADGDFAGGEFVGRYNIQNKNPQAVQIAHNELASVGIACGRPVIQDTQQWHGAYLQVELEERPRTDDPNKKGNEIVGYYGTDGQRPSKNASGRQPAPTAQPALAPQPTPQPQPATNGGTPPWQQAQQQAQQQPAATAPWQQQQQQQPQQPTPGTAPPWAQPQS